MGEVPLQFSRPKTLFDGQFGSHAPFFFFVITLGLELNDTTSLRTLNTSPPRNCLSLPTGGWFYAGQADAIPFCVEIFHYIRRIPPLSLWYCQQ